MSGLYWLPEADNWRTRLQAVIRGQGNAADEVWALARSRLNFVQLNALDAAVQSRFAARPHDRLASRSVRLAVLSSSTATHLHSAIRVAGLRWGIWIETYECAYGQYRQELIERGNLHSFNPTHVLLALDAEHLTAGLETARSAAEIGRLRAAKIEDVRRLWDQARSYGWTVIQQTPLPCHPTLLGLNEHRLPGSRSAFIAEFNHDLRAAADAEGIDLLAVDARAGRDGLAAWHSPALWHSAKQEISPTASPVYGDLVARLLAARLGCTYKCLALDLDNTLWGGVVGDDGVEGIVIGQGSPLGEAYAAFQDHCRELARRGVILAVCSKNDEANALEPFDRHPDMVLRRADIACFVANWSDKAANIRQIAHELNIGLDSLVFVDDNPFERNLVRQELPMVAVPEVGDDPTGYAQALADAGYFEGLSVTAEDRARTAQYHGNRARAALQ
ncbi:MAG: HAD-IIIC family phosphatase, partial [Alphaproteobacteria bacterium]|nr:HAD-IIIC family phosphatase [Alphaproteobacteria bacterium]